MYLQDKLRQRFANLWNQRYMGTAKVFWLHPELELAECLNKRHAFNVSYCSPKLYNAYLDKNFITRIK